MKITELYDNEDQLQEQILFFTKKKQIVRIKKNNELILSHLTKAKHNLNFYEINKENENYSDWLIVTLHYALYHCALALITNKNYLSKNHSATVLLLIKEYSIDKEEVNLLEELFISKEDAQLYTDLKFDRHQASYATSTLFSKKKIKKYRTRVIEFMRKAEQILDI